MNKTVIVLGTARSGTSLLAGILHKLGVNLDPVIEGNEDNPKGGFENPLFISLTTKITKDLKAGKNRELLKKQYENEIKSAIEIYRDHEIWGWKSALTHFCIDFFLPYIENPYIFAIFRNPLANAFSLIEHWKRHCIGEMEIKESLGHVMESNIVLSLAIRELIPKETFQAFFQYEEIIKIIKDELWYDLNKIISILGLKDLNDETTKDLENFIWK